MGKTAKKLVKEIEALPDTVKLSIVDTILSDLDKPDPKIDRVWAKEAQKRWKAYKSGRAQTVSYESIISKHRLS